MLYKPDNRYCAVTKLLDAISSTPRGRIFFDNTTLLYPDINTDDEDHARFQTENFYYIFVDLNGDGITDALKLSRDGGYPEILWNCGNGFAEPIDAMNPLSALKIPAFEYGSKQQENGIYFMDYNQEGRPEILMMGRNHSILNEVGLPKTMKFYQLKYDAPSSRYYLDPHVEGILADSTSNPGSRNSITSYDYAAAELAFTHPLDIDGNDLLDILSLADNEDGSRSLHLYKNKDKKADLLTGIREGTGSEIRITYESLLGRSDQEVSFDYPSFCVASGLWVVSEYSIDRGYLHQNPIYFHYHRSHML